MEAEGTSESSTQEFPLPSPPSPTIASFEVEDLDGSPNHVALATDAPVSQRPFQRGSSLEDLEEAGDAFSVMSPPNGRKDYARHRLAFVSSDHPTGRESSTFNGRESLRVRSNSNTVRSFAPPAGPQWEPGAEPGIDPEEMSTEDLTIPHVPCRIVVFDYSPIRYEKHVLNEINFRPYIAQPRPQWVACRWICVDGLNPSIVKLLGRVKKLHRLAIEDTLKARSRPKADWYADHCYICLTMQTLVKTRPEQDPELGAKNEPCGKTSSWFSKLFRNQSTSSPEDSSAREHSGRSFNWVRKIFRRQAQVPQAATQTPTSVTAPQAIEEISFDKNEGSLNEPKSSFHERPNRTFQRWRGGIDVERIEYMEGMSALLKRGHSTHIEQVSIFMTDDDTVISFFEGSAREVIEGVGGVGGLEARIAREHGVLQRQPEASMLLHAILDVIVDLAMPIAEAYDHALGHLQLEILKCPDIEQPNELFTLISEIDLFEAAIEPLVNLINSLKGYEPRLIRTSGRIERPLADAMQMSSSAVITPLTNYYLSDIKDHVLMLHTQLSRMRRNTEHLTNLIFSILASRRNSSMKLLTVVTIVLLPINFLFTYFYANSNFSWAKDTEKGSDSPWIAFPVVYAAVLMGVGSICYKRRLVWKATNSILPKWVKKRRSSQPQQAQAQQRQIEQLVFEPKPVGSSSVNMEVNGTRGEARTSEGASNFA